MTKSNDVIILDETLSQKLKEIAPELSPSDFFEIFTAEQILKDYDLSYDEITSGIVGGGNDGGIDGLFLFVNGELVQEDTDVSGLKKNITIDLHIIQAKTGPGFSEAALDKFVAVTNDLLNLATPIDELATVYNAKLLEIISTFRQVYRALTSKFPTLKISYHYATKGDQPHKNVERKVATLEQTIKTLFSSALFDFEFIGAGRLLALARRSPRTSHDLKLAETPISSTGAVGFVCLVKLRDFYAFITEDGKLLRNMFEANVRDYQGSIEVNEGIQKTLREKGNEEFWWLNNGITVIASKATQSGKVLTIEDPQIVNGLQTSTEIYNFFKSSGDATDERNVLVRVIVPPAQESRDRIIHATNSQTKIPVASLRATEKIHRDIEELFRPYNLFYDRRKNFYKNEGKPLARIVSIPQLAQAVMAIVLQRPDDARARPSSLLNKDEDYQTIFRPNYPILMYYVCAELMKQVEAFLKSESTRLSEKPRTNLRFYLGMYVSCELAQKADPSPADIANLSIQQVDDSVFIESLNRTQTIYNFFGATDKVAKGTEFLERLKTELSQ